MKKLTNQRRLTGQIYLRAGLVVLLFIPTLGIVDDVRRDDVSFMVVYDVSLALLCVWFIRATTREINRRSALPASVGLVGAWRVEGTVRFTPNDETTSGPIWVSFPPGKFSQPPIVFAWPTSPLTRCWVTVGAATKDGANLRMHSVGPVRAEHVFAWMAADVSALTG